ncbi:hypothetical protein NL676_030185 [Syzygium grande]|nr:hypothetical protein NL676_030185 [Syzygium grande]
MRTFFVLPGSLPITVTDSSSPIQRTFHSLISPTKSDARSLPLSFSAARGTRSFACVFILTFIACTFLFVLNPAAPSSSPWLTNLFAVFAPSSYRSHFSSMLSHFRCNPSKFASLLLSICKIELLILGVGFNEFSISSNQIAWWFGIAIVQRKHEQVENN